MARVVVSMWKELRISENVRRALGIVFVFSIFCNLLVLTSPIYMLQVYNRVLMSGHVDTLVYISIIAVVALAIMGLLDGVRAYILTRLGRFLDLVARDRLLFEAIGQVRLGGSGQRKPMDDFTTARNYLGSSAVLPFMDAPWVPFFVVVIALIHPWLGILAVVSAVILFGLALANDFISRQPLRQSALRQFATNEFAASVILNADVVNAMGMQAGISQRHSAMIADAGAVSQRASDIGSAITAASKAIRMLVQSAALGLGAYLVLRAEMSPGGMIAASIVLGRALAPIEQTIGSWKQFLAARDSYDAVKAFLENIPASADPILLPQVSGKLSVEDLSHQMPGAAAPVLRQVSFQLEPGTALAVVGPSASGKSTLCRLLVGALTPARGHVRLDGADVCGLNSDNVAAHIGYLPQNVELFAGTVRENIARLGVADDKAVIEAAQAAGCHEMILRLPQGYDTELGARGAFLSGGQRQRIGLARALYRSPSLIVLDEPNSNLDQEGELALIAAIVRAKEAGTTIVVVSHRSSLLQPIDKLAVLRDGVLERFGDRDQVLRDMAPPQQRRPTLVPVADGNEATDRKAP